MSNRATTFITIIFFIPIWILQLLGIFETRELTKRINEKQIYIEKKQMNEKLTKEEIDEHCEAINELGDTWGNQAVAITRSLQSELSALQEAARWLKTRCKLTLTASYFEGLLGELNDEDRRYAQTLLNVLEGK